MEELSDISETESNILHELLNEFIISAEPLISNHQSKKLASFRNLYIVKDLMRWSMKEIMEFFNSGKMKEMNVRVIARYVRALFSESAQRARNLDTIMKGYSNEIK